MGYSELHKLFRKRKSKRTIDEKGISNGIPNEQFQSDESEGIKKDYVSIVVEESETVQKVPLSQTSQTVITARNPQDDTENELHNVSLTAENKRLNTVMG